MGQTAGEKVSFVHQNGTFFAANSLSLLVEGDH